MDREPAPVGAISKTSVSVQSVFPDGSNSPMTAIGIKHRIHHPNGDFDTGWMLVFPEMMPELIKTLQGALQTALDARASTDTTQ